MNETQIRTSGELEITERLRSILTRMRETEGVVERPELEIDAVRDTDRGLGWRIPDDVLAVLAAHLRVMEQEHELTLTKLVGHTGRVRALGAPGDLIGLGKTEAGWLCARKGPQHGESTTLLVWSPEGGEVSRELLVDWLEERSATREGEAKGAWRPPISRPPLGMDAGLADDEFRPRLARRPPAGSTGQRVRHKTFGEGRVLLEMGSGPHRKVKVDFPGKGLKLLQARFLEWPE